MISMAACPPGRARRKGWSVAGRRISNMAGMRVAHDREAQVVWRPGGR
jgi:hypothetical protein